MVGNAAISSAQHLRDGCHEIGALHRFLRLTGAEILRAALDGFRHLRASGEVLDRDHRRNSIYLVASLDDRECCTTFIGVVQWIDGLLFCPYIGRGTKTRLTQLASGRKSARRSIEREHD